MRAPHRRELVPLAQGVFYIATGLWPIVHLKSFEAVTGPKVDRWLVRTVGGLISAVGAALMAAAFEQQPGPSRTLAVLGIGSAIALGASDVIYASRGRISKVYYVDAVAEAAILAAWAVSRRVRKSALR
ncbi:MAG: hypothetical protein H0T42_27355 [Deltaproteobacteria bacterium]|nr:hypothetical protein [Deltaproteobacteria bacterium]